MTAAPVARSSFAHGSPAAFEFLRRFIYTSSAIVLEPNKDYLFECRLAPLLQREGLDSLDALVVRLGGPSATPLRQRVVEAMTTNETLFFRDAHPFEAMRKSVLPALASSRAHERRLALWSAAASTGQELYSLAMLVAEQGARFDGWDVKLIGTDLSLDVLAKARSGRYTQLEVNRGLPAPQLVRHFDKEGVDWIVKPALRRLCDWQALNLVERWPALPAMDVVFLRNVLIYFDPDTKRRVLESVARVLRPGGFLFLGGAESTLNLSKRFVPVHVDKTICYRLEGGA